MMHARPYTEGAAAAAAAAPEEQGEVVRVSAETAAAWGYGHQPDYNRKWPECVGKCIQGACVLLKDTPRCCFVKPGGPRRQGGYRMQESDAPSTRADLMAYWLNMEFYCRR